MADIKGLFESAEQREPQNIQVGIGGFNLVARVREGFSLTSSSPDSFLEDGSTANDHIVNDPLMLMIEGEAGDIYLRPDINAQRQRDINSNVGRITKYLPLRTQSQISKINGIIAQASATDLIDAAIEDGRNAYEFFGNKDLGSKGIVEQFIDFIEAVHYGKQIINIDMPYRTHKDMRIVSFECDTDNQSRALRFVMRAKKLRYATVEVADIGKFFKKPSPGLKKQNEEEKDKGAQTGEKVDESFLSTIFR